MPLPGLPSVRRGDRARRSRHRPLPARRRRDGARARRAARSRAAAASIRDYGETKPPLVAWIDEERCIGCARCLPACPVDAIVGAPRYMHTVIADAVHRAANCASPPCPVDCIELRPGPSAGSPRPRSPDDGAQAISRTGSSSSAHKREALRTGRSSSVPAPARSCSRSTRASGSVVEPVVARRRRGRVGTVIARPQTSATAPCCTRPCRGAYRPRGPRRGRRNGACLCIELENDGLRRARSRPRGVATRSRSMPPVLVERLRDVGNRRPRRRRVPDGDQAAALRATRRRARLLLNGAECEPWICCDDALMRARRRRRRPRRARADACARGDVVRPRRRGRQGRGDRGAASSARRRTVPRRRRRGGARRLSAGRRAPAGHGPDRRRGAFARSACGRGRDVPERRHRGRRRALGPHRRAVHRRASSPSPAAASRSPCNVRARLGTPLAALVDAAGGYRDEPLRLIAGGNMTGRALASDAVGAQPRRSTACSSRRARDLQPRLDARRAALHPLRRLRHRLPAAPAAAAAAPRARSPDARRGSRALGLWDCIDCGCCDYVCPSQIPLAQRFREARARLRDHEPRRARAAAARERYRTARAPTATRRRAAEQQAFDAARARRAPRRGRPSDRLRRADALRHRTGPARDRADSPCRA